MFSFLKKPSTKIDEQKIIAEKQINPENIAIANALKIKLINSFSKYEQENPVISNEDKVKLINQIIENMGEKLEFALKNDFENAHIDYHDIYKNIEN